MPIGKLESRFFVADLVKTTFSRAISREISDQLFNQNILQCVAAHSIVCSCGPRARLSLRLLLAFSQDHLHQFLVGLVVDEGLLALGEII